MHFLHTAAKISNFNMVSCSATRFLFLPRVRSDLDSNSSAVMSSEEATTTPFSTEFSFRRGVSELLPPQGCRTPAIASSPAPEGDATALAHGTDRLYSARSWCPCCSTTVRKPRRWEEATWTGSRERTARRSVVDRLVANCVGAEGRGGGAARRWWSAGVLLIVFSLEKEAARGGAWRFGRREWRMEGGRRWKGGRRDETRREGARVAFALRCVTGGRNCFVLAGLWLFGSHLKKLLPGLLENF